MRVVASRADLGAGSADVLTRPPVPAAP